MSIKRGDETFVDATGNQYDFMLAPAGGHGLLAVASGDAAPSDGPWLQGDIMWNSDPDSGDPVGWVCTIAGSPGTWKAYGVLRCVKR